MNPEMRDRFLNEAVRIGDELLALAEHTDKGLSWKTMFLDDDLHVVWAKVESIYNGVSGIALFFLQLYEQTRNEKYLNTAIEGMCWVEHYCRDYPSDNYAFYTGRMGVSYTLLKLFEATGHSEYLERALENAQSCNAFYESSKTDDLLNGIAGMLLGLLHLHAATGEHWLLEKIKVAATHLIDTAHHGPVGLYWDRAPDSVRGLCGFSHGAAGIGFVFLELGHYFQADPFFWMAEQAFSYETHFFDASRQNWPDFRRGIYNQKDYEKHERAYREGDLEFFTNGHAMNAWCHGAAGIGLSRLRAFELLGKSIYAHEVEIAIKKTVTTNTAIQDSQQWRTHTLCHGGGGDAELFLEAYRVLRDERYWSMAGTVATQALGSRENKLAYLPGYALPLTQEDTSLFMGNAGIGYFYLRLLDPLNASSILAPQVKSTLSIGPGSTSLNKAGLAISRSATRRKMIEKIFRRTLYMLQHLAPEKTGNYFEEKILENRDCEKTKFMRFAESILAELSQQKRERVADVYDLELEKVRMDEAITSHALLHIEEILRVQQVKAFIDQDHVLLTLKLRLNPAVQARLTDWDWSSASQNEWGKNLNLKRGMYPVLLRSSVKGIIEERLSPLSYTLLAAFQSENVVENVVQDIIQSFEPVFDKQKDIIKDTIIQQVKQALLLGILTTDVMAVLSPPRPEATLV